MNDFEVLKSSVEEVTTDVVKIIQKLRLGVDPKDVTDNLMKKTNNEELILINEQRKWFLEMDSTPGRRRCCDNCCNDNKGFRILHELC